MSASKSSEAPLRASAARHASGSLLAALTSIMRRVYDARGPVKPGLYRGSRDARYASITAATPSASAGGQVASAIASRRSCASSTAIPKAAHSSSSRSFSPSPNATVFEAEKPRCSARNCQPRSLRHLRACELEEVRERLGDVEASGEALLHLRLEPVELLGVVDDDELRGWLLEPREQIADLVDNEVLKAGVALRCRGLVGDKKLVVDVAVEAKALSLDGRDRLPRKLERDGDMAQEPAAYRLCDHGSLVADDGIVDPELECVGADGLEHPSCHDHHVDARGASLMDGGTRALAEH